MKFKNQLNVGYVNGYVDGAVPVASSDMRATEYTRLRGYRPTIRPIRLSVSTSSRVLDVRHSLVFPSPSRSKVRPRNFEFSRGRVVLVGLQVDFDDDSYLRQNSKLDSSLQFYAKTDSDTRIADKHVNTRECSCGLSNVFRRVDFCFTSRHGSVRSRASFKGEVFPFGRI